MGLPTLIATIGANISPFERQIHKAGQSVANLGRDLKSRLAGIFTIAAAEESIRRIIEMASRIKELSETSSVSVEDVQKLDAAAKKLGLTFEDVAAAIEHFGEMRKEALMEAPGGEKRRLLERYGINANDLSDRKQSDLDVAKRLKPTGEEPEDRAAFRDFFGNKRGGKILAVLKQYDELRDDISTFSEKEVTDIHDAWTKVKEGLHNFSVDTTKGLLMLAEDLSKVAGVNPLLQPAALAALLTERAAKQSNLGGAITGGIGGMVTSIFKRKPNDEKPSAPLYSELTAKAVDEMMTRVQEIQEDRRFKLLNPGAQQRFLKEKITESELKARRSKELGTPGDISEYIKETLKGENLKTQLQDLIMGQKNTMSFDSLSKIGGFNAFSDVGIKGLTIQERIARASEKTAMNTTKTADPHGGGGM